MSAVTFIAASQFVERTGGPVDGLLVALLVALEVPALLIGLSLGRSAQANASSHHTLQEVFTGKTAILLLGEWEPAESRVAAAALRPGDFAIDIGANHGWFTLLMAEAVGPEGLVLGVEPCPPQWAALGNNLELNGRPDQVEVRQLALGAEAGEMTINLFEGLPHGHASTSSLGRDDVRPFTVEARTLDQLVGEIGGARRPALIKLDVEGAERVVVEGAGETLASGPIVLLEVNVETSQAFGYRPSELLADLLAGVGSATAFRVEQSGLMVESAPESAPHGTAWLVVPEDKLPRVSSLLAPAPA